MMRPVQTMETMYEAMLERRKSLVKKETAMYQFDGSDRFSILYYNQQRDAAFAKARIPPFGDGQVAYQLPAELSMVPLPPRPARYSVALWGETWPHMFREQWKAWYRKREDLDKQYLEACGIILMMLGPEPLAYVQQYMRIVDGREKFTGISDAIRRKYYPVTNLEVEIMLEWISKSTDEYGLKIWFSLWQEAIDLIQLVKPAVLPKPREFIRFMETGMTNRDMKVYLGTLMSSMVPNLAAGAPPGAMRSRRWREIREELLEHLNRDPSLEDHLRSQPKVTSSTSGRISALSAPMTFATGVCYNCGDKSHMMRECTAKQCSRCGKSWPSESSIGFHRCWERNKCPMVQGKIQGPQQYTSSVRPPKKSVSNTTSSNVSQGDITRRQYKAHFKEGKSEGFKAALAMMREGKSVADIESSALGKHSRSS